MVQVRMRSREKRVDDIVGGLSPEDKARVAIEDLLRAEPVISPTDYRKMLGAMRSEEGRRYNAFIHRFQTLKRNLDRLMHLVNDLKKQLLDRDRLLFYLRALEEMEENISSDAFNTGVSKALLIDNPNLRPGRPLEVRVTSATIRLGVWGKRRIPVSQKGGVHPDAKVIEILTLRAKVIRTQATGVKALFRYVKEESQDMGLEFIMGLAIEIVDDVAEHDRSMKRLLRETQERSRQREEEGLTHEERLNRILTDEHELGACIFPVDDRWALEWDEIDEDEETGRSIREDPEEWPVAPVAKDEGGTNEGLLDRYRAISRVEE